MNVSHFRSAMRATWQRMTVPGQVADLARRLWTQWQTLAGPARSARRRPVARQLPSVLVVLEGAHDITFLKSISRMLHTHDAQIPDLTRLEVMGRLIFVPVGGCHFQEWGCRFAPLGQKEFHLYDREVQPATAERQRAVEAINRRPGCVGCITGKRAMENYLAPAAIHEAGGGSLEFADHSDVVKLLAQRTLAQQGGPPWSQLNRQRRKRLRDRVKHWLNNIAVQHMTPERLAHRDPAGEVAGWLRTIARLADYSLANQGENHVASLFPGT